MATSTESRIRKAYSQMHENYGPQGWWPVECERRHFDGSCGAREREGYHPGQFDFPRTREGRFEIGCGAVLTQNTAWTNVQKALDQVRKANALVPETLKALPEAELGQLIRPAGYYNQKTKYLLALARWFEQNDSLITQQTPSRAVLELNRPKLLAVRGIGPETADSILLYAYGLPTFVVDAYTRRVLGRLGLVDAAFNYEQIRTLCERALEQATLAGTVERYQEAHALIVEHAKRHHTRKADPAQDFLLS